jgi:enoyl-CoA hydratase
VNQEIGYEIAGHVATVTINRPHRRNAINRAAQEHLAELFDEASADPEVRVVVVTGAGDQAFCSGADLKELDEMARSGRQVSTPMTGSSRNVFEVLLETYKPTIAALNGPAVAGGCELALACDLRIASEHAFLALPEAKRGMGANFASVLLPRLLPRALALEMLYTGVHMDAATAAKWGLYNRTVPAHALRDTVAEIAENIAANAPLTIRRYKEMAVKGWELPVPSALRLNVGPNPYISRDREEGVRAYLEGRQPRWEGRLRFLSPRPRQRQGRAVRAGQQAGRLVASPPSRPAGSVVFADVGSREAAIRKDTSAIPGGPPGL